MAAKINSEQDKKGFAAKLKIRSIQFLVLVVVVVIADFVLASIFLPKNAKDAARISRLSNYYNHGFAALVSGEKSYGTLSYPFFTNSLGLADGYCRQVPKLAKNKRRILLMGDSFMEGVGFPFQKTVAGLLQQKMDSTTIEIINAGCSSYSPRLHFLRLKHLLQQDSLRVNEIVCFMDYSDVMDELVYEDFEPKAVSPLNNFKNDFFSWLVGNSMLTSVFFLIRQQAFVSKNNDDPNAQFVYWVKTDNGFLQKAPHFFALRSGWHRTEKEEAVRHGKALALSNAQQLYELAKQQGIKFSIGVYPPPGFYALPAADLRSTYLLWEEFCTQRQLPFINLHRVFFGDTTAQNHKNSIQYFISNDSHWNEAGHQLVADTLYNYLR